MSKKVLLAIENELDHYIGLLEKGHDISNPAHQTLFNIHKLITQALNCEFCKGTGYHLSPEVAQPITVKCENKNCKVNETSK